MIELVDISKAYEEIPAVLNFSLQVSAGSKVAILGPSGCGKTTVLRLIAGLLTPDQGRIVLNGTLLATSGRNLIEPQYREVGMVFQDLALWPHFSVRQNLMFPLKFKDLTKEERQQRLEDMLQMVQLNELSHRSPGELSGGQQQRVALARALISHPKILLMDEPLSNLDLELNIEMRRQIRLLQERVKFTLIYVTHNMDEASDLAEQIVLMDRSKIRMVGSVEDAKNYLEQIRKEAAGRVRE